jgi:hypothetical protein
MPDRTLPPEDLRAWQRAREQQPYGYPADADIGPYTPGPIKEAEYGTTDFLRGIGSFGARHNIPGLRAFDNPQYAKDVGERLTLASEFTPGYGDVLGVAEGAHLTEQGHSIMGPGIMGVSMLPIIGDIAGRAARKKAADLAERRLAEAGLSRTLTPSPTRVERTVTGPSTAETRIGTQMSRTNYETNAERSILARYGDAHQRNPRKRHNVDHVIDQVVGDAPQVLETTLRRQLDEWIGPEFPGRYHPSTGANRFATIQEILDQIGRNKPQIREQVSENIMPGTRDFIGESRTQRRGAEYLPNIPTPGPAYSGPEALQTLMPLRYTERNLSTHVPGEPPLHRNAGHSEVGQGDLREIHPDTGGNIPDSASNVANRLFNQRSGLYEIDGKKVFIPAEGQSGVYRMGTSSKQALRDATTTGRVSPDTIESMMHADSPEVMENITSYLDDPYPIKLLDHEYGSLETIVPPGLPSKDEFLRLLGESGHTLDDWNALVKEQREYLAKRTREIHAENISQWNRTGEDVFGREPSQALILAKEDSATRFVPQFTQMISLTNPGVRNLPTSAPFFDEWFPLHMKTALNDAVEQGADTVRFPINDYAVARQTGQPLSPYRAREFREEFTPTAEQIEYLENPNWTGWEEQTQQLGRDMSKWQPNKQSQALATHYQKRTNNGLRRIEAEYGVELNPRPIRDNNNNVFLEIDLTPELKEAFQVVIFNRGGEVRAPLMPLKYRG